MSAFSLDLLAWRRDVAQTYADVRLSDQPAQGHAGWCRRRDALFAASPESPLPAGDARRSTGLPVPPYDPAWRAIVPLEPAETDERVLDGGDDGAVRMRRVGVLRTPWGSLDAWWLPSYGGGLFVPVGDAGSGTLSYGGGRYLLDTVKGADLGAAERGLVVDLNFLYNPSCAYDPRWTCPLAPPGNVLAVSVPVGELLA